MPLNKAARTAAEMTTAALPILLISQWQNHWTDIGPGDKLYGVKPIIGNWPSCRKLSKREEVAITRFRIGHTHLTHGHLMNKDSPPLCSICQCSVTVHHVLIDCPVYHAERLTCNLYTNLSECLDNDLTHVNNFLQFLRTFYQKYRFLSPCVYSFQASSIIHYLCTYIAVLLSPHVPRTQQPSSKRPSSPPARAEGLPLQPRKKTSSNRLI